MGVVDDILSGGNAAAKGGRALATPPPAKGPFGSIAAGVRSTPRSSAPPASAFRPSRGGTDAQSSGPGYGSDRANAFKRTPAYHQAVKAVFHAQPPQQQAAIIKGLGHQVLSPAAPLASPEARAVRDAWGELGSDSKANILKYLPQPAGRSIWDLAKDVIEPGTGNYGGGKATAGLPGAAIGSQYEMFGGPKQIGKILSNAGTDLKDLPGNTIQGIAKVGIDAYNLKFGNVLHDFVDPYVNLFHHPESAYQHPLNTAMMFAGPEAAVGRAAGAVARSGALGERAAEFASTARAPLRLGPDIAGAPNPIHEARSYSPNLGHKAVQKAWENHLAKRGIDPNVARPARGFVPKFVQNSMNIGLEAKTRRIADEMTAVRQMAGREDRQRATVEMRKVAPPKEVRHVVSHILQGVVRKPETASEDLSKEINRLKAAQTGARSAAEIANRRQVKDLTVAMKHPELLPQAFATAKALREFQNAHDAYSVSKGLLDPEQAARSKLGPYAIAHMGAKYDHAEGRLVGHDGSELSNDAILQHLKDNGVPDPAYVGHYPNKGASYQFYQRYKAARGSLSGERRTYAAFNKGNYDHTYDALVAQAGRTAEAATKAGLHDKVVNRLGISKPPSLRKEGENGMFTPKEAKDFIYKISHDDHGNPIPGVQQMVPISAMPAHSISLVKDLQHPAELMHTDGIELRTLQNAVDDAQRDHGQRNVVLVPRDAMDQFTRQFEPQNGSMRKIGQITQQFRRTVLPYSTHWMMQIGSEAALRGLVAGVLDPRNIAVGRQVMHELTKDEAGRSALQEMVNATFYNKRDPLAVHNPNRGLVSEAIHSLPPTRQLIAAHNAYADRIGGLMYHLEHEFRTMSLGKLARQDVQEFTRSYQAGVKLQGQNLARLTERLRTDPALVAKFGRQIDETFGKYNKLSPQVRAAVQSVAPFLPWYLNAAKFVLWTLPVKHPVASSLLASLRQTINQDVQDGKQMPLNAFQQQALSKITPFGIYDPPEYSGIGGALNQAAQIGSSMFLPQIMGSFYNYSGKNSFGDAALKGPNGPVKGHSPDALKASLENLLEAFVPAARYARLAQEGGKPSYGTSTVFDPQTKNEPGTSVLNRIFNPLYAFERAGSAGKGGGKGSVNVPTVNVPTVNVPTVNVPTVNVPTVR